MSPRARALRIALLIAAALLLLEWGTRESRVPGTSDLIRYRAFPEQARALVSSPATSIAFVGNSVTDRLRAADLQDEWQSLTGAPLRAEKFVAYYSNLATWYRMSAQYFWKPGLKPDLIVVTYYEGNGLADSELLDVGNLALFFTDGDDRASLFEYDLDTLEQRADYLISSKSEAFAARDRMRDRTLNFIPGYRSFAADINGRNFEFERRKARNSTRPAPTFDALRRFLAGARQAGIEVCFVAFPSRPRNDGPVHYIIEPKAIEMIAEAGMLHLDMRVMNELSADMYQDNVHLNVHGQPIYTRRFAQELSKVWRPR
jgi:hypothetical protein